MRPSPKSLRILQKPKRLKKTIQPVRRMRKNRMIRLKLLMLRVNQSKNRLLRTKPPRLMMKRQARMSSSSGESLTKVRKKRIPA